MQNAEQRIRLFRITRHWCNKHQRRQSQQLRLTAVYRLAAALADRTYEDAARRCISGEWLHRTGATRAGSIGGGADSISVRTSQDQDFTTGDIGSPQYRLRCRAYLSSYTDGLYICRHHLLYNHLSANGSGASAPARRSVKPSARNAENNSEPSMRFRSSTPASTGTFHVYSIT